MSHQIWAAEMNRQGRKIFEEFFERRSRQQAPKYLWIGRAHSRAVFSATVLTCAIAACTDPPAPATAPPDSVVAAAPASDTSAHVYDQRVVLYIEGTTAEIDSAFATYSADDRAVVGDDLMWYRAMAYEYLEKNGFAVIRLVGRRPLAFVVNGVRTRLDLSSVTTADYIVVYDANREPRIIAPVDIEQATTYFNERRNP